MSSSLSTGTVLTSVGGTFKLSALSGSKYSSNTVIYLADGADVVETVSGSSRLAAFKGGVPWLVDAGSV